MCAWGSARRAAIKVNYMIERTVRTTKCANDVHKGEIDTIKIKLTTPGKARIFFSIAFVVIRLFESVIPKSLIHTNIPRDQ